MRHLALMCMSFGFIVLSSVSWVANVFRTQFSRSPRRQGHHQFVWEGVGGIVMKTQYLSVAAIVLYCGAANVELAHGELVRFDLSGTIEVRDPHGILPDDIVSGLPFTGSLAYDRSAEDLLPDDPNRGVYQFVPASNGVGVQVQIGAYDFQTNVDWGFRISVGNDIRFLIIPGDTSPPEDSLSTTIPAVFPFDMSSPSFKFHWFDRTLTSFDDDRLPTTIDPALLHSLDVDSPILDITGFREGTAQQGPRFFHINALIDRIVPVPEPSAWYLLVFGMLTILSACRRRIAHRR